MFSVGLFLLISPTNLSLTSDLVISTSAFIIWSNPDNMPRSATSTSGLSSKYFLLASKSTGVIPIPGPSTACLACNAFLAISN